VPVDSLNLLLTSILLILIDALRLTSYKHEYIIVDLGFVSPRIIIYSNKSTKQMH